MIEGQQSVCWLEQAGNRKKVVSNDEVMRVERSANKIEKLRKKKKSQKNNEKRNCKRWNKKH